MPDKPNICIYHSPCMDGFGAAYSVYVSSIGNDTQFEQGVHGTPPPDVTDKHVYIVDFSYPHAVMVDIAKKAKSVTILDHHASAKVALQSLIDDGVINGFFDMARSGAMIAWEYFNPSIPAPDLIKYIQDTDLRKFDLPDTREIHAGLSSYPHAFDVWDTLFTKDLAEFKSDGQILLRKVARDLELLIPIVSRKLNIGGYLVPVANVPHLLADDVGEFLAKDAPFAATYYDSEKERVFSLRSVSGGLNVWKIAKEYCGGGHKRAAGFRVPLGVIHELEPGQCIVCDTAIEKGDRFCSNTCESSQS